MAELKRFEQCPGAAIVANPRGALVFHSDVAAQDKENVRLNALLAAYRRDHECCDPESCRVCEAEGRNDG